ncbi:DUF7269 family protein [Haloarcula japonica]|uniref:Uncharacterized protein n=1 Tax=Haloarcula japonica (strain ATCC 49778 / DSM 6131 / JCM 7785 / NBRC 101032 / NCIMB 13157 / TR-1) TaxID=1227453 RepID=M0LKN1_HALJT|nr:hypothetical protein [Haloarcula japonica]EMA34177.1 hypothetical protein C444_01541 [Haloarcula japonica DSM 6131]
MTLRRVPLALGLVATAIGVGLAAIGAPLLPAGAVSDLPILAAAVFAGGVALLALLVRSLDSDRGMALPDTDSQYVTVPGDDIDEALSAGAGQEAIRKRVEGVAVTVLQRNGLSPDEATDALRSGAWADREPARELFDGTPISLRARLSGWLSGIHPFQRRVAHATAELRRRDEER